MKQNRWGIAIVAALTAVVAAGVAPVAAFAQDWHHQNDYANHRWQQRNDWRNLAIATGGVAAYGFVRHDPTLAFAGTAGALYSIDRYNQERNSNDRAARVRATFFSQPYFYRDGHRYNRTIVTNNGHRAYRFVRGW